MTLAALVTLLLMWITLGTKVIRNQRNWPPLALILIGVMLIAHAKLLLGAALIGGGAVWLRKPRWRKVTIPRFGEALALAEAYELLDLAPGASRADIIAAHRRLIAHNHPDSGGSEDVAARLNAARDTLLKSLAQRTPD